MKLYNQQLYVMRRKEREGELKGSMVLIPMAS